MPTVRKSKKNDQSGGALLSGAKLWEALRNGYRTNREINASLAPFSPNSAGSARARADLTLLAAHDTIPLLCDLLQSLSDAPAPIRSIESVCTTEEARSAAEGLGHIFTEHGSDKASHHNYHLLYASILAGMQDRRVRILEVGLGTNNPDVVSHMGVTGKPGASLRAFRDFLPGGEIFGADVDRRVLFSEDRIATFYVDQTRQETFGELAKRLGNEAFDLVIDDGLHAPNANLNTLAFALQKLKSGGYAVVEDIHEPSLPLWNLVGMILPSRYEASILSAMNGYLFVVRSTGK